MEEFCPAQPVTEQELQAHSEGQEPGGTHIVSHYLEQLSQLTGSAMKEIVQSTSHSTFLFHVCMVLIFFLVPVSGQGITMVRVSRISASAPGGAEEDPQLSQHQR